MLVSEAGLCVAGYVTEVHPSFCMDGATHLLNTPIVGSIRIKPSNEAVRKALDEYSGKDTNVTVCGFPRRTENCHHIEACTVAPAEEVTPKLMAL